MTNTEVMIAGETMPATRMTTEQNMIQTIAQIVSDPSCDVLKMEKVLDIQIRMMDRQAKMDFDNALAELQSEMPRITPNGEIKNKHGEVTSRYMKYEDIDRELRPLLAKYRFSIMHDRIEDRGKMLVTTRLKHQSGHEEKVSIPLPFDAPNALKNAVQCAVSTFSYGKRVNVCSLFNIVEEGADDDGQTSEAFPITAEQAAKIDQALNETNADRKAFLVYMGAETIEQIPATLYDAACRALTKKGATVKW